MQFTQVGELSGAPFVSRHPENPVLEPSMVPFPCSLTFNAGVAIYEGRYVMVFRNDMFETGDPASAHSTNLGFAESDDGVHWRVRPEPFLSLEAAKEKGAAFYANRDGSVVDRIYDPRITILEGVPYICFAMDTMHGVRAGIARTRDFHDFEILSISAPENRNTVLFPERIGRRYVRLERPFPVYSRSEPEAFDIWIASSGDLADWGRHDLVLGVEDVPFSNRKIGPGAPPIRTERGWLTTFHAVDFDERRGKHGWEASWKKRYTIGLMLLDPDNPAKVIAKADTPLMVPEAPYETDGGFRNHVLFPGGMTRDGDEVRIYYGAADTVECVASADIADLLAFVGA
jgi:beta-1,4-mannooligosaccharide/beta-1,4-mannosyl-N-acetylglucosamine phosphorylase